MKIATVTPYDLSLPGGVNRYALDIARWVRSQGHDVQVIGPASSRNGAIPTDVTILGSPRSVRAGGTIVPIALDPGLGKANRGPARAGAVRHRAPARAAHARPAAAVPAQRHA